MPMINSESAECIIPNLDLFNIPPTDTSFVDSSKWHIENPITSITRGGVIDFVINSNPDVYLDLNKSYIDLEFSINDSAGKVIKKEEAEDSGDVNAVATAKTNNKQNIAFPEQYFSASLFKNVEVFLNDSLVSNSDNMYAYRAYIEALLSYNKNVKNEHLNMSGWFEDDNVGSDVMEWRDSETLVKEDINDTGVKNKGVFWRFYYSKYSTKVQMIGRIHSDIFNQVNYIPGKHQLKIKFHLHSPEFCIRAAEDNAKFTVQLEKMQLGIKKCEVGSHIREAHERKLLSSSNEAMKYAFNHVQMKFFMHSNTNRHLSEPNLCNGLLPNKIVIALVDSSAFNGDFNLNPFNFQNFGATSIVLRKNGFPTPYQELSLNYEENRFLNGYMSMISGTGNMFSNETLGISPQEYKHGKCVYVFDLANSTTDNCLALQHEGRISLDIKVGSTSNNGITIIAYLQYDSVMHINNDNDVYFSNKENSV